MVRPLLYFVLAEVVFNQFDVLLALGWVVDPIRSRRWQGIVGLVVLP